MKLKTLNSRPQHITHEGAPARHITPEQQLARLVSSCLLWENTFYVDGQTVADQIREAVKAVSPEYAAQTAIRARTELKLRHVPLLIVRKMARLPEHRALVAETLAAVIQRPDELTEFLAIYWQGGRQPLSGQVKKGLARAFPKFNAYQLAKYNRDGAVRLRDVLFLTHPTPQNGAQEATWKALVDGTLAAPDTWEVALSAGADKAQTFIRLLDERKLGALALLRNLRGMLAAGVPQERVRRALRETNPERVLPFRFITAARAAPTLEPELETLMLRGLEGMPKLAGHTVLLLDASGSMTGRLSRKSELSRYDAAAALAMLARELCGSVEVYTFSDDLRQHRARRGFALRDELGGTRGATYLGAAVREINTRPHDRLIVFTDEQSHDPVPSPRSRGYLVNVATDKHGVGYGPWVHVDGFSEQVMAWIQAHEQA